jgi:hypothetical protein
MALSQSISIQVASKSVEFAGAYARVSEFHGTKNAMSFVVQWAESQGGDMLKQATYRCQLDLDGENPVRQAYLHLKSLPEFAGATDC